MNNIIKIRSEAIVFFMPCLLIGLVFIWLNFILAILFFCITLYIIYFFRDPDRKISESNKEIILSPADGKITSVKEISREELKRYHITVPSKKLSIFMSIFDVHVNRAPISGKIIFEEHVKGSKIPAFYEKSSDKNEHMNFIIKNDKIFIYFRLIAGILAQRIKSFKKVGAIVVAGERIGMIKFGSRVDIIIPNNWCIVVKKNQNILGGSTILAERN